MLRRATAAALMSLTVVASLAGQPSSDLPGTLARIGRYVEGYYPRVRSLLCRETVRLQPLGYSLSPDGPARHLVYELRVEWTPPADGDGVPEAQIVRTLVRVDGRAPRPRDEPGCMDPRSVSPEPLAMLLPTKQGDYEFRWSGTARVDRRPSVKVEYRSRQIGMPEVIWKGDCVSVDLPGYTRGQVWADQDTAAILRVDEQLTRMFEFPVPREHSRLGSPSHMVIERADSSIRYKAVRFDDPDETLMLPASIQTMTIVRNAGVPRMLKIQTYSNYQRFVTGGRIIEP